MIKQTLPYMIKFLLLKENSSGLSEKTAVKDYTLTCFKM